MTIISKKTLILVFIYTATQLSVFAASMNISAPNQSSANRQPFIVEVSLDTEGDTVSGFSGNFSFDSDLFVISNISSENTIASLWVKQPAVSNEIYLDGRTHIVFEGIFPGGFSGVRSPYEQGVMPGKLFQVTLLPKEKGRGTFLVDGITIYAFNSDASQLKTSSIVKTVIVPQQTGALVAPLRVPTEVHSNNITAFITRDPLVNNNAWYLVVNEDESKSAIDSIYVSETNEGRANITDASTWRKASSQYILRYQNRNKYIHVKVSYVDGTYAVMTLPPVENSHSIPIASRILGGVALALLVLYFYVKLFFTPFTTQPKTKD